MLNELVYKTPQALAFAKKYECARVLRNNMDHLAANAQNVGGSKGRPTIFGVLGYICVPEDEVTEKDGKGVVTGGMTVALGTGRFITPGGRFDFVNPAAQRLFGPVAGFRLEAFGEFLPLEEVERDLRALMAEVNNRLEEQALAVAGEISKERGIPIETLMSNPPGSVVLLVAFDTAE